MNVLFTNSDQRRVWQAGALLVCLALLMACEKPPTTTPADAGGRAVSLNFSAGVIPNASTRAVPILGDKFPSGNYKIGLWVCSGGQTAAMTGYNNILADVTVLAATETERNYEWKYTFEGGTAHEGLSVKEGNPVTIYAYHPWKAGVTDITAVPFTSSQDDWMWATPQSFTAAQTNAAHLDVPLAFTHAMTCIQVNVKCKYDGNVRLVSMTLTDKQNRLVPSGTMNALTGELTAGPRGPITLTLNALLNAQSQSFCIIMPEVKTPDLPAYVSNDFTLSFKFQNTSDQQIVDGRVAFDIPDQIRQGETQTTITEFTRGTRYIYSLELENMMYFAPVEMDDTWILKPETDIDL
ncbi:MAG: fimbrillin family protein [Odoribacteraceae bacterium]|jgi:hypothetical protein|nr:fimbrillin family protein [Odoribacteraceae bacterium]